MLTAGGTQHRLGRGRSLPERLLSRPASESAGTSGKSQVSLERKWRPGCGCTSWSLPTRRCCTCTLTSASCPAPLSSSVSSQHTRTKCIVNHSSKSSVVNTPVLHLYPDERFMPCTASFFCKSPDFLQLLCDVLLSDVSSDVPALNDKCASRPAPAKIVSCGSHEQHPFDCSNGHDGLLQVLLKGKHSTLRRPHHIVYRFVH